MNKLLIMFAFFSLNAYANQYEVNLTGKYRCDGREVGDEHYFTCDMSIKKYGETYSLKSVCDDKTSYVGTGIYDTKTHLLALAFTNPKNTKETGIVLAEVKNNSILSSSWTYLNQKTVGHGACKKL